MHTLGRWWRLGPSSRDHLPAARSDAGVALPLVVLQLDHLDLAVFASFAAFTGIYARHEPAGARARHQAQSALLLLVCITLGLTLAYARAGPGIVTLTGAVVAAAGARMGLRPAGALFFVFTVTGVGTLPAPPRRQTTPER